MEELIQSWASLEKIKQATEEDKIQLVNNIHIDGINKHTAIRLYVLLSLLKVQDVVKDKLEEICKRYAQRDFVGPDAYERAEYIGSTINSLKDTPERFLSTWIVYLQDARCDPMLYYLVEYLC
jgi:hypothetical protein